jgi:hypothetical protein
MSRVCTVCTHHEHHKINIDLIHRKAYRTIADRYGLAQTSLKRHAKDHIPLLLVEAYESLERGDAESLVTELAREKQDVQRLKGLAEAGEDYRTALLACDKALKALELQAKVEQLIAAQPTTNVVIGLVDHPDYVRLEDALFRALEHHHEARWSVAAALKELDEPPPSP